MADQATKPTEQKVEQKVEPQLEDDDEFEEFDTEGEARPSRS